MTKAIPAGGPIELSAGAKNEARAVPLELRNLLNQRPDLSAKYQHFQNAFHEEGALDARLLELCRARIDALHGVDSASLLDDDTAALVAAGKFSTFSADEQQALSVAEQLAIDAHGLTDEQIGKLNASLGEAATVSLLTAVSMHDASIRMQRVLQPLNGDTPLNTGSN